MGPPGSYGGSGSHKDIKLTLLNKVTILPLSLFIHSFLYLFAHITKATFCHLPALQMLLALRAETVT